MAKKISKRFSAAAAKVDTNKAYNLTEAVALVKDIASAKFVETVDLVVRLGLDSRKADQNIRGSISLPHGLGKDVKVAVVANDAAQEVAKAAGADFVGSKDLVEKIKNEGWLDFDVLIATPDQMATLAQVARVLGPRGLMPNPKTGTVTTDVETAVKEQKAGKVEYRLDKFSNVHLATGKVNFDNDKLEENISTLVKELLRVKPSTAKGTYVKSINISSTQGPAVKLNAEQFSK